MNTTFLRWLPLVGLLLVASLEVLLMRPPRPVPATAPGPDFSAQRALRDVVVVASQPHPLGSPANARVRDYLLKRCHELGLATTVQDTSMLVAKNGQLLAGRVQNIIARLPGRQPGGRAVLVLAHYDSQPHAPGAGDDGAGVAAMLETMRALRAGPPLPHDVIWLFSDGEEAGLLGARAYARDTARLRREVGVVLNFEGRGNAGPSLTFEVSPQNGWVMREYARAAPYPIASSLFYEAYRHLPNDTDFTPLRAAGLTGLNFAFVGGYPYYHSPADTPAHLDLGSLQHHGSYMLSLVRHFGSISLARTKAPDETFFNPIGHWLVHYPAAWNLPFTLLSLGLLGLAIVVAYQRGWLSIGSLLGGALVWLGGLALMLGVGWGLLRIITALYPQYGAFYDQASYNAPAYQAALLALGVGVFAAYYGWLSRYLRPGSLVGGALLLVALLAGLLQWRASSSAFLLTLPLLAATVAWGLRLSQTVSLTHQANIGLGQWLLALPVVALLSQVIALLFVVFGLGLLALAPLLVSAVLLGLLLPVLLPIVSPPTGPNRPVATSWALPALAFIAALGALGVGHATRQPTADQPQQTHLFYALDAPRQRAYWLSAAARPGAWTSLVLTRPQYQPLPALFPQSAAPILHQAAPVLALAPPTLVLLADESTPGQRRLCVRLVPGRAEVSSLLLSITATTRVRALRVAGQAVAPADLLPAAGTTSLTFFAPRAAGELIELSVVGQGPVQLAVTTRSLGLPPVPGLPPLPPTLVPEPGYNSFTTQVRQEFRL